MEVLTDANIQTFAMFRHWSQLRRSSEPTSSFESWTTIKWNSGIFWNLLWGCCVRSTPFQHAHSTWINGLRCQQRKIYANIESPLARCMLLSVPRIVCRVFVNMRLLLFGLIGGNYWSRWISISLIYVWCISICISWWGSCQSISTVHHFHPLTCLINVWFFPAIYTRDWLCCVRVFASMVRGVDQHHRVNYNETWFMKDERLGCVLSCEVVFSEPKLPAV